MQHKTIKAMKRYWPDAWLHVRAEYDGVAPLQNWLDMNVVRQPGAQLPTAAEIAAKVADYDAVMLTERRQTIIAVVRAEAEARIAKGTVIGGTRIKCDVASIGRLHGMVTAGGRNGAGYSRTFMTDAGVKMMVNKAQVESLFDAAEAFIAAVLDRSATLQERVAVMTEAELAVFNPPAETNWPPTI